MLGLEIAKSGRVRQAFCSHPVVYGQHALLVNGSLFWMALLGSIFRDSSRLFGRVQEYMKLLSFALTYPLLTLSGFTEGLRGKTVSVYDGDTIILA